MLQVNEQLIRKCIKGENKAITELYRMVSAGLYGVCLRYTKSSEDAQDLLHDGFLKIMENIDRFRGEGSFEGWIRRIVVNEAINFYRRKNAIQFKEYGDVEYKVEGAEISAIEGFSQKELLSLLNQLPTGYRIVFNLFAIEGYTHMEIAEMLSITENTSKSQYRKARLKLQELILKTDKIKIKEELK